MVRLSVVIPCRNEAARLPGQLRALAEQQWTGWWELVVVDNGSTDGTAAMARSYSDRLPIRVVAESRSGRQHACNAGARAAAGDALVFLDADDEVAPGYLAAMEAALARHELVGARLDCETLNAPWLRRSRRAPQTTALQDYHFLPVAAGCSMGIRREAFLRLGGCDPALRYGEDVDLCWRAQLEGVELRFAPDAVLRYRYRHRLPDIYRQARGYGRGGAILYRRFRPPAATRRAGVSSGLRRFRSLVGGLGAPDRGRRAQALWDLGYLVGWFQASLWPGRFLDGVPRLISGASVSAPGTTATSRSARASTPRPDPGSPGGGPGAVGPGGGR